MKTVSMSGSPRESVGKKDAKALRTKDLVPCVLYGGSEQIHFSIDTPQFRSIIYTPSVFAIELDIKNKGKFMATIKDLQFHKVSDALMHVDFLQIIENKPVIVNIPVIASGNAAGVKAGGKLVTKIKRLTVKGLVDAIPDSVEINVDNLGIGDGVRVADLKTKGIEYLDAPNSVVVSVQVTRAVKEEAPGAAAPAAAAAAKPAAAAAPAAAAKAPAPAKK